MDPRDDESAPAEPLQRLVAAIAEDAANVLSEHPDAEIVGLIAESGTIECKRVRTLLEQGTGTEYTTESFAGIVPTAALAKILDGSFPADAFKWMADPERARELHVVICAKDAIRVASVKIPRGDAPPWE